MGNPLKSMPKVGDHVRYIGGDSLYLTNGDVYEIVGIDYDGEAFFMDNLGEEEYLRASKFGNYETLGEEDEDLGYIQVLEIEHESGDCFEVTLEVDERMLEKLYEMERNHRKATEKARIQSQIDELQKKLKEL